MRGVGAVIIGAGVAIASGFAPSWGLTTDEQRIGFVFAVLLVVVGIALFFRERNEGSSAMAEKDDKDQQGDVYNVTSHDQSGGITAGSVHISAPQASVTGEMTLQNAPQEGGGFLTSVILSLTTPQAAQALCVDVHGSAITAFDVGPRLQGSGGILRASMRNTTRLLEALTYAEFRTEAPLTTAYRADVLTDKPDELTIDVRLD